MSNDNVPQANVQRAEKSLLLTMAIVVAVVAAIAIVGFLFLNHPDNLVEGQVEGTTVRVSGKLPGRVVEFYVEEGDTVKAGDTIVHINSSLAEAQLTQAQAMEDVARAQNRKADAGTRPQIIKAAADLVSQAQAAVNITQKTYERMQNLYSQGVISEQKRDEAKAAYDAAVAARNAAANGLSLAKAGAQSEDKQAAAALVTAAGGGVAQVKAMLEDSYLIAPCDGTVDQLYPEPGELIAPGSPVASILKTDNRYIVFNVREELLANLPVGKEIDVMIPALNQQHIKAKVYYVRDMGSYATWRATKSNGSWDSRTFQIKARPTQQVPNLRPGMSIVYEK